MPKPKTYKTHEIKIPADLVGPIKVVTSTPGTWQRPFQNMAPTLKKIGDQWFARAKDNDIADMKKLAQEPKAGSYQKWSDEILKLNNLT